MKEKLRQAISGTRFVIVLAALGAFVASLLALVYGLIIVFVAIRDVIRQHSFSMASERVLASNLISIIDLFLLGTVLYIIALGLYKLFIDEEVETPHWLEFRDLDDIKTKILSVVVVLLGVEFLASVVEFTGNNILQFGIAIGVVLIAIAAFMYVMMHERSSRDKIEPPDAE